MRVLDQKSQVLSVRPERAAQMTGLSRAFIFREMAAGRLASVKAGSARLIRVEALNSWLRDREEQAS